MLGWIDVPHAHADFDQSRLVESVHGRGQQPARASGGTSSLIRARSRADSPSARKSSADVARRTIRAGRELEKYARASPKSWRVPGSSASKTDWSARSSSGLLANMAAADITAPAPASKILVDAKISAPRHAKVDEARAPTRPPRLPRWDQAPWAQMQLTEAKSTPRWGAAPANLARMARRPRARLDRTPRAARTRPGFAPRHPGPAVRPGPSPGGHPECLPARISVRPESSRRLRPRLQQPQAKDCGAVEAVDLRS